MNWFRNIILALIAIPFIPAAIKTLKNLYSNASKQTTKVGLISLKGPIADASLTAAHLKQMFEDDDIVAILLKIDSPGGAAGASQALYSEILERKKIYQKPVVAWVQNICASGGYYVASAADTIVATPVALIGSVGAYFAWPQFKEFVENYKVHYHLVPSGKYKTTFNPFGATSPEELKLVKQLADNTVEIFIADVIRARPQLGKLKVENWAEGRIFTGQQALELGLIDQLGSQITVEETLKKLADITTDIEWVKPAQQPGWLKFLSDGEDTDEEHPYIKACVAAFCTHLGIGTTTTPQL